MPFYIFRLMYCLFVTKRVNGLVIQYTRQWKHLPASIAACFVS